LRRFFGPLLTAPPDKERNFFKDALFFVPFIGTALAVFYEFGSFLPLGRAFGLFGLSEHILFALEPLPLALVFAILMFVGVAIAEADTSPVWGRSKIRRTRDTGRKLRVQLRITVVLLFLVGLAGMAWGIFGRSAISLVLGFALQIAAVGVASPRRVLMFNNKISIAVAVCFALLLTMAIGVDTTRLNLRRTEPADFVVGGKIKKAVYIRSGERGLLLYDPALNEFSFEKWDDVKRISWSRGSILGYLFEPLRLLLPDALLPDALRQKSRK
jgi:hypothetical protein